MEECPFCEIVAGRAPAHVVGEDELTMAFLDINPMTQGHTLVVPKAHVADLWTADSATAVAVMRTAHRIARRLRTVLEPQGLNLIHATGAAAFQSVFHLHLHVVPRWATDGLAEPPWPQRPGEPSALAALADRLGGSGGASVLDVDDRPRANRGPARLVLVVGLPGAGKTTLARTLAEEIGAVRMCPDEWMEALGVDQRDARFRARLEALLRERSCELLRRGVPVVNEYGLWSESEREALRQEAQALGVPVELHVLDPAVDELWRRVQTRNADPSGVKAPVTREELESWRRSWEPPTAAERARYDASSSRDPG